MTAEKMYRGRRCSSNDAALICSLFESGRSVGWIAMRTGHSKGSVSYQILRNGAVRPTSRISPSRRFSPEQDALMLKLRLSGATSTFIANKLGMKSRLVENRLYTLARHELIREGASS